MALAFAFGKLPNELLQALSANELNELLVFAQTDPLAANNLGAAQALTRFTVAAGSLQKADKTPWQLSDFWPNPWQPNTASPPANQFEQIANL